MQKAFITDDQSYTTTKLGHIIGHFMKILMIGVYADRIVYITH